MAITGPTLIDTVESTVSAASIVLTVPAGGVPAEATIFVDCQVRSSETPNIVRRYRREHICGDTDHRPRFTAVPSFCDDGFGVGQHYHGHP